MLDENLDPFLIEVNHAPSFATDSNLDMEIKKQLLLDSFKMLNMSVKRKIKYKKESNKIAQNRIFTGRKDQTNQIVKDKIRKQNNIERHKFEYENKGRYELLYPLINEKGKIVGKHSAYMYEYTTDTEIKPSSRNNIHEVKLEIETGITQSSTQDLSEERVLTEIEIMNNKYQQYIDDAFEVWDDL
jgi:tubulin polyglutamylase TTLL6/13